MRVSDLIEELSKFPDDMPVLARTIRGDFRRVHSVEKDDVYDDVLICSYDRYDSE